ncbi:MAG: hypothetical protein HKO66_06060 [Saprospiraceae bacterium]|nr:aspartyl protease family protein [Bacteroidia bacterium]NNE15830.1 hypothetical protein [Saprospiraceae bacterium]NNL91775.1 hypothetical protein [Saprospiraceae bacterium]
MKKLFKPLFIFWAGFLCLVPVANAQVLGLELLDKKDEVKIDFKYAQGFILVDVKFNNSLPLTFILDTGAEHVILFNKTITDILGIQYEKRISLVGSDLEKEVFAFIARNITLTLEECKTVKRDIIVLEEDFLHLEEITGEAIHGIVGSRFFRGLVMEINYRKKKLKLINSEKFDSTKQKNYTKIPIEITGHKPYINCSLLNDKNEKIDVNLLIDTGSALPFLLFMESHPSLVLPKTFIKGNLGKGLGGDLEGYLSKLKELSITDEFKFTNIVTSFQPVPENFSEEVYRNRNGLIGNPILSRFDVTIDFVRNNLYLKPNKKYNRKFEYDKSGLTIYAFGANLDNFFVKDILENSPASEAGIQKGDMIKKVGFWPAHFYTLGAITRKFQKNEGKKIKMVLERNGHRYKTHIILRDMLNSKP